jgi:hypothetical protein
LLFPRLMTVYVWNIHSKGESAIPRERRVLMTPDCNQVALSSGWKNNLDVRPLLTNNSVSSLRFWLRPLLHILIIFDFERDIFKMKNWSKTLSMTHKRFLGSTCFF